MLHNISLRTLVKFAGYGGFILLGTGYALNSVLRRKVYQTDFYKEGFKKLNSHKGIVHFLGSPIIPGTIKLSDRENNCITETEAKLKVPVNGQRNSGNFYIFAARDSLDNSWNIHRLELGLKDEPNKRILVFNAEN